MLGLFISLYELIGFIELNCLPLFEKVSSFIGLIELID